MDLYSNNRMLDWEARRRIIELRSMATRHEGDEQNDGSDDRNHEPFTGLSRTWHTLFHRANHNYERA